MIRRLLQILTAISAAALAVAAGHRALASEEDAEHYIKEATARVEFVIVKSTVNYDEAQRIAAEASKRLRVPMELRDLAPTSNGGLSFPKAICEENGWDAPCYAARGRDDDGAYVSIEHTSGYPEFKPNLYIVVVASDPAAPHCLTARRWADDLQGAMKARIPHEARISTPWLPVAGVGTFIALYFLAASLYPGGTRADHQTRGYSHLSNYWCDLLDRVSYSGAINPGRPFAVLATIILPLSLVPLWLQVPVLFRDSPGLRRFVQATGSTSMVLSTLVFTSLHDLVINVASILGFVAVVTTILGLVGRKRRALVQVALLSMSLAMTNYLMWQTGSLLWMMPMVQKAAFTSFFFWIIATSHAVRRSIVDGLPLESAHRPA